MKRKPQCWQKGEPILRGTGKEWQLLKKKIMRNTARRQSFVSGSLKSVMHTMKSSHLKSKRLHLRLLHVLVDKTRETLYLNVDGWHFSWSPNTCHGDGQIYGVGRKIAMWPTSGRDLCEPIMRNIWIICTKYRNTTSSLESSWYIKTTQNNWYTKLQGVKYTWEFLSLVQHETSSTFLRVQKPATTTVCVTKSVIYTGGYLPLPMLNFRELEIVKKMIIILLNAYLATMLMCTNQDITSNAKIHTQIGKYLTKVQPSTGKLSIPTDDPRSAKKCHSISHEGCWHCQVHSFNDLNSTI